MDEYSSVVAFRRLWSKDLLQKQRSRRKDLPIPVSLPVLNRYPSTQQIKVGTHSNSLHALLASQLKDHDRESYSRSQVRAMTSSKLLSNNNNKSSSSISRIRTSTECLAPLNLKSFEKTNLYHRRPLPGPLQAAINEVLAVRKTDELLYERGDSDSHSNNSDVSETPVLMKRSSPCKRQNQDRRPEWQRYIRRIMMTKGIRGSTLARYRRLVGIVARKSLATSVAGATERVVVYRLEFQSAVVIKQLILHFLYRRRRAKELQRCQAATKIQLSWKRRIAIQQQLLQVEIARKSAIERLTASRVIQRSYRKYQSTSQEKLRQQQQNKKLHRDRAKLLQRYQAWRQKLSTRRLNQESDEVGISILYDDHESGSAGDFSSQRAELSLKSVQEEAEVVATCTSIDFDCAENTPEVLHNELQVTANTHDSSTKLLIESAESLDDEKSKSLIYGDFQQELDQSTQKCEEFTVRASVDENQAVNLPIQDNQGNVSSCKDIYDRKLEIITIDCKEPEDTYEADNNDDVDDIEVSVEESTPADLQRALVDLETVNAVEISAVVAEELAAARQTIARRRIVCYLLPKLQDRKFMRTRAAVQIQCLIRSFLAKLCLVRVRIAALHSLRAQLRASWHKEDSETQFTTVDKLLEENTDDSEHEDDENVGVKVQKSQPHSVTTSDNYLHLLPTRNGQIPPGVPLLQSSAGAPLLTLWKWSWPEERWLGT